MTPTRWPTVVSLLVLAGIGGWGLAAQFYADLVTLPRGAPFTAAVIALFELGLARVVGRAIRGERTGRPMHPLQVARAAALAKASSVAGALLTGFYAGFFLWVIGRVGGGGPPAYRHDAWVSAWSGLACLLLLVAGLLLERACRTPRSRDEMPSWTSTS
jgi:hypothetical protein